MKRLLTLLFVFALLAWTGKALAGGTTACYNNSSGTIRVESCQVGSNEGCNNHWTCIDLGGGGAEGEGWKCAHHTVPMHSGSTITDECAPGFTAANCYVLPPYPGEAFNYVGLYYEYVAIGYPDIVLLGYSPLFDSLTAPTCAYACSATTANPLDMDLDVTTCVLCIPQSNCSPPS
jgi:hypothetical protein